MDIEWHLYSLYIAGCDNMILILYFQYDTKRLHFLSSLINKKNCTYLFN
jgi:hypothetical protein